MNSPYFWPICAVLILYLLIGMYKALIERWFIGETFTVDKAGIQAANLMQRGLLHSSLRLVLKRSGRGWVEMGKRISKNGEKYIRIVIDEKGYSQPTFSGIAASLEHDGICFSRVKRKRRNILYIDIGWDELLASAVVKIALGQAMGVLLHEEIRCKKRGVFKDQRI